MSIQIDGIQLFDNSGEKLETRLRRAIERYETKFGKKPTHCQVSLKDVGGNIELLGITVLGVREMAPHNILIGVEAGHG